MTYNIIYLFIDIPTFNIKYIAMHKVLMHAGSISILLSGFASVWAIIVSLKLAHYLHIPTHKPYNDFSLFCGQYIKNQQVVDT